LGEICFLGLQLSFYYFRLIY